MGKGRIFCAMGAAVCALAIVAPNATAGPGSASTAIVSLGDSYISGEAGRWQGNSTDWYDRDGTDRACVSLTWYGSCNFDYGRVYLEGTYDNGCHRSDVADIKSAGIAVNEKINLACSGAVASNTWRSSNGGTSRNGEPPQADRLLTVAQQKNVKLVVLSIGGNDLGFAGIIIDCTVDWSTSSASNPDYCQPENQADVNAKMPTVVSRVGKTIDEVRAVMSQAGYSSSQYRIMLRSYPSPIPRGSENRYPETGWSRLDDGGCPFWNADSNWARDTLVGQIANNLRAVALNKGVQFLDMRNAMQDREVCSNRASQVTSSSPPNSATKEWVRWLNTGFSQGDAQESMHPNSFGQRAAGRCIQLAYAQPASTHWACRNQRGYGYSSAYVTQAY